MKFIPRDYQHKAHDAVFDEWKTACSTLVLQPVGTGKTCLFAMVIKTMQPKRAMVVAHREELIWQARSKITAITGLECGIEMGELHLSPSLFGECPVIISTIQTLSSALGDRRRMSKFNPKEFGVLVCDEAHRCVSATYRDLINYFRTNNPAIKILFVTATSDRADESALGQVCETVAFDYEILDAIHDGWLLPIEQQFVTIGPLDFSQVRTTAGDLNGADLAAVMEVEENMQGVAAATIEMIGDRRTLIFTASVKQAETVSNILNRHKPGICEWVCGKTNKDVRKDINARFESGQIQVVANCGIYTEGYDNPAVEVIVMAKPTKSRALYTQMVGRAIRPLPGVVDGPATPDLRKEAIATSKKPVCTILDFSGNSGKHKLVTSADILGGKVSDDAIARAIIKAKQANTAVRMSDLLDESEEEIRNEMEARRRAEEARKARLVARVQYSSKSVNPFDVLQISPVKERGWDDGRVLSEKQRDLLLRQGINPDVMSYSQGKQILNTLFDRWGKKLATLKQLKVLARYGYTDTSMTAEQASKTLDAIAKNGWRRTAETTTK